MAQTITPMKRTHSRIIKLPSIIEVGGELATGLNEDEVEELNVRSYDYGRRTAIPTLNDYIIEPFGTTFRERAFWKAVKKVGLDSEGILNDRYPIDKIFNGRKFVATAFPNKNSKYEVVLSLTENFLNGIIWKSKRGEKSEGVRKIDGEGYVFIGDLLDQINQFKDDETIRYNDSRLTLKDLETDKKLLLDEEIEKMRVYFNLNRFARISPKTADGYYNASSLEKHIKAFLEDYSRREMKRHGVSPEGLEENIDLDYELSDGSAVRYLFSPNPSTKHGQIYSGLTGKTTKNIARSTGDLDTIKELAFKGPYEFIKGEEGVRVRTYTRKGKKGQTSILRLYKDKDLNDSRRYYVFSDKDKIYVKVKSVLDNLKILTESYTSNPTKLKIDIFTAPPTYLR
ncbi:MAG: hypothetical protein KAW40_05345 [Candidatus Aenigmarchaeota archaeon]|nr:hypothetical protein [Candidatus Aenigmarchaeota archaeon]